MGKWVLAARHPCNDFISAFRNCLIYESAEEFSAALARSAAEEPAPLSADDRYQLSWEAATERCVQTLSVLFKYIILEGLCEGLYEPKAEIELSWGPRAMRVGCWSRAPSMISISRSRADCSCVISTDVINAEPHVEYY